jgi:hypothetical protein
LTRVKTTKTMLAVPVAAPPHFHYRAREHVV